MYLATSRGATPNQISRRKRNAGAFWEDCYHVTAVDTDEHLARCFTYIVQNELGTRALSRYVEEVDGASVLRDAARLTGRIPAVKSQL